MSEQPAVEQADKIVIYYDEAGEPVRAIDLVTEVQVGATRSADRKMSAKRGAYGDINSQGAFASATQSLTAKVPPGASPDVVQQIIDDLYFICAVAVTERIDAEISEMERTTFIPEPVAYEDDENGWAVQGGLDETGSEAPWGPPQEEKVQAPPSPPKNAAERPTVAPGDAPPNRMMVEPKAAERIPGQWWVILFDSYKLENLVSKAGNDYQKITFYNTAGSYPVSKELVPWQTVTGTDESELVLSEEWLDAMKDDSQHHDLEPKIYGVFVVTHGRTTKKNYEARLVRLTTRPEMAVPPAEALKL